MTKEKNHRSKNLCKYFYSSIANRYILKDNVVAVKVLELRMGRAN